MSAIKALAISGYVASILAANWLTTEFGLVPAGFGLMVTAGTYAAGLALFARDVVQDVAGRRAVVACIVVGAALSWLIADPFIAAASATAFLLAEVADFAVYTPLRSRGWARAVLASNTVGAVVDTFVFLGIAGFPITLATVTGQLVGKVLWATALPLLVVAGVRRAVPREPQHAGGA